MKATTSQYDEQASKFLADFNIKFRATLSDTKAPAWSNDGGGEHGHHYRVTLSKAANLTGPRAFDVIKGGKVVNTVFYSRGVSVDAGEVLRSLQNHDGVECDAVRGRRGGKRITFDFWGSIADAKKGETEVAPYAVLSCISGDCNCPGTFADFCAEYGFEADSIKALQMFRRCDRFGERLRKFFTAAELRRLAEII